MALQHDSLIFETTTTTGTGAYTLAGAKSGYRAFSAVCANGDTIRYVARMGSDYEIGLGTWGTGGVLTRTLVIASSNANAAVSWGAGTKNIYCAPGADAELPSRHNLTSATFPVNATDDDALGYYAGSVWRSSTGANGNLWINGGSYNFANWIRLFGNNGVYDSGSAFCEGVYSFRINGSGVSVNSSFSGYVSDVYCFGGDAEIEGRSNYTMMTGHAARNYWRSARVHGYGYDGSQAYAGGHQRQEVGVIGVTTDATPTALYPEEDSSNYVVVQPNTAQLLTIEVTAYDATNNVGSTWRWQVMVKRQSTNDPSIVGTNTPVVVAQDAGAAAWAVALTIDTTNDALVMTVTGAAATTIAWTCEYSGLQAGST